MPSFIVTPDQTSIKLLKQAHYIAYILKNGAVHQSILIHRTLADYQSLGQKVKSTPPSYTYLQENPHVPPDRRGNI